MVREMVNMAKVNTLELAKETGVPTDHVERVVQQIIINKQNHKRQPKPPPPEGGISLRAAERKYGIKHETISLWIKRGYLPELLRTKNELYVEEGKLVKIIGIYLKSPGRGKRTIKHNLETM